MHLLSKLTNYAHLNRGSVNVVDIYATYRPGIVGTKPSVIPPVVADGSNPHRRWPRVSPGIVRYSFTDLGRMEGWVGLAARGGREIWWYDLHGNPERTPERTLVTSMVAQWFPHYLLSKTSKIKIFCWRRSGVFINKFEQILHYWLWTSKCLPGSLRNILKNTQFIIPLWKI